MFPSPSISPSTSTRWMSRTWDSELEFFAEAALQLAQRRGNSCLYLFWILFRSKTAMLSQARVGFVLFYRHYYHNYTHEISREVQEQHGRCIKSSTAEMIDNSSWGPKMRERLIVIRFVLPCTCVGFNQNRQGEKKKTKTHFPLYFSKRDTTYPQQPSPK